MLDGKDDAKKNADEANPTMKFTQKSAPEHEKHDAEAEEVLDINLNPEEIAKLQQELAEYKTKAQANWEVALRTKAEMENIQRRMQRDIQNAHQYSIEKLINQLIPVLDSLEQALLAAEQTEAAADPVRQGVELTYKMFHDILAKFGVSTVDPKHAPFDPKLHEALAMQPSQEVAAGHVINVVQKGYLLHDRVVRPARVIVAK